MSGDKSSRVAAAIIQVAALLAMVGLAVLPAFTPKDVVIPFYVWAFLGGALLGADPEQFIDVLDVLRRIVRGNGGGDAHGPRK